MGPKKVRNTINPCMGRGPTCGESLALPLVSIIIPCYNARDVIEEAILSALESTYDRKEIVVIDDGSDDKSVDVLKSFRDSIRWETGPNRGACAARNRGIQLARGDLIQFLDADDLLHQEKLARQAPLAVDNADRIVYCDGEIREADGTTRPLESLVTECEPTDPVVAMLQNQLPTPAPLHWKKDLLAVGGFREGLPCSQERDLHLRLACAGARFLHLPQVLYTVRKMPGSLSSDRAGVLAQHKQVFGEAYDTLKRSGQLTEERAIAFAGARLVDGMQYLSMGLKTKANDCFRDAGQMHANGGCEAFYHTSLGRTLHRWIGPLNVYRLAVLKNRLLPAR